MAPTRNNLLPKKDLQLRFIIRIVAIVTAWGLATAAVFAVLISRKLDDLRYSSHIDAKSTWQLLLPTTIGVHLVSLVIFAALLAYSIHSLWKKLSPPLHSIKKDLARISCGDLTGEVSLSKYQEFQSLAKELDEMRMGLREKISSIKEQQKGVVAVAAELDRSVRERGDVSLESATALRSALERMKEKVATFRY